MTGGVEWELYAPDSHARILRAHRPGDMSVQIVTCTYTEISDDEAHIHSIVVRPDFRGRGLATAAIDILRCKYKYFSARFNNEGRGWFATYASNDPTVTASPRDMKV